MILLYIDTDPTEDSRALIRDVLAKINGLERQESEGTPAPTPTSPNTAPKGMGGRRLPEEAAGWGDPTDALLPPEPVRDTYDLLASMPPDLLADIERVRGLTIPAEPTTPDLTYSPVPPFTEDPSGEVRTTTPTELGARPAGPRQDSDEDQ